MKKENPEKVEDLTDILIWFKSPLGTELLRFVLILPQWPQVKYLGRLTLSPHPSYVCFFDHFAVLSLKHSKLQINTSQVVQMRTMNEEKESSFPAAFPRGNTISEMIQNDTYI